MQGIDATPTFLVNGKLVYQNELRDAVDAALAEVSAN
jgi:protein-disulfide isomerase